MKVLFAVNGFFIVGLFVTLIWAGLAIGKHEEFQGRMTIFFLLQAICIAFMVARRILMMVKK